jgi:hypothetical protein
MRKTRTTRIRRRRRRQNEEAEVEPVSSSNGRQPQNLGPHYQDGPAHTLRSPAPVDAMGLTGDEDQMTAGHGGRDADPLPSRSSTQVQMPTMEGEGEPVHKVAFNRSGPLRLHGRTDATYDGGAYRTENVTQEAATGCSGCSGGQCVHVTGTLVATYSVQTRVTLPSVSDFPDLTPCQQRRVQDAIDNVLAPHEQEHVRAFEGYNGVTRRAFDLTLCRSQFAAAIQQMFEAEERARRQAAQAASDALDPFNFDVDLDCEEPAAADDE